MDSRKRPPGESPTNKGNGPLGRGKSGGLLRITDGSEGDARRNLGLELEAAAKAAQGSPVKPDTKRPRMSGTNTEEAGSGEEHRQQQ
jgi:hypothetical protein